MKIAIVNTCANGGGAARAANRLHEGLRRAGHESIMYVLQGQGDGVICYAPSASLIHMVQRKIRSSLNVHALSRYSGRRPEGLETFTDSRTPVGKAIVGQLPSCDVVNLHWVAGFVDYACIPLLGEKPMVWTLHDMNPFTGGCHYDNGCDKYRTSCGACPQLGSGQENDLASRIWHRKQKAIRRLNPERFHLVAPSKWLADQARQSTLFRRFPVSVIPNGLDTGAFAPRKTDTLRQIYGIAPDDHVLLFLADSITNERKGLRFLLDAVQSINDTSKLVLMSVGQGIANVAESIRYIQLGRMEDDRMLSLIYSMADVFVVPSIQDNLPNTVLESIASGTPVIGFDIGGIPDMVREGESGLLVPARNVASLKSAIEALLWNDELRKSMAAKCREIAVKEYDLSIQAQAYSSLYSQVIQR